MTCWEHINTMFPKGKHKHSLNASFPAHMFGLELAEIHDINHHLWVKCDLIAKHRQKWHFCLVNLIRTLCLGNDKNLTAILIVIWLVKKMIVLQWYTNWNVEISLTLCCRFCPNLSFCTIPIFPPIQFLYLGTSY